jgi:hypothetical protein
MQSLRGREYLLAGYTKGGANCETAPRGDPAFWITLAYVNESPK